MSTTTARGSVQGFDTIVLENSRLRAVIIPQLGGRVWELEDRARGRQWIWHRDDVPLRAVAAGAVYDDVWAGGWEELFPNDAPGTFEDRDLPDHGEWWTLPWHVEESSGGAIGGVRLSATSSVVRAQCTKEFRLTADAACLTVDYRIRSGEPRPFHFLFKQHLPVRVTPDCRLLLPGGRVQTVDPSFGTLAAGAGPFDWPRATTGSREIDLRAVPQRSSGDREFVYVRDLPESWCAVEDTGRRAGLRMTFAARELPYVWLFLSYGGWRNTYTAVLEPCSNMPKDLAEAVGLGQSACLAPGQEFRTAVSVELTGLTEGRA